MRLLPLVAAATAAFLVVACSSPTPPRGVTVVNNFDAKRYLGTWYEIARFDHRFERGLEKVTATYSLRDDGGLSMAVITLLHSIGNTAMRWFAARTATTCGYSPARQPFLTK